MIKVYYLQYCSQCKRLLTLLDEEGISYEEEDADVDIDTMNGLEAELGTKDYPIVSISNSNNTTYFVADNDMYVKVGDNIYKRGYQNIDNLLYQIKKYEK
jgi:arsenate reductase-like glutaredoxin family protein